MNLAPAGSGAVFGPARAPACLACEQRAFLPVWTRLRRHRHQHLSVREARLALGCDRDPFRAAFSPPPLPPPPLSPTAFTILS